VITILAILATIAFIQFQNYTKDARDGNRLSTMKELETGMELYTVKTGMYPNTENVTATGIYGTEKLFYV
jgi:type II secretory pathway pseudopilin PulG